MRDVIVGVDGSPASFVAMRWAAQTVGAGGRLHCVAGVNPWTEYLVDEAGDHVPARSFVERDVVGAWTSDLRSDVAELVTSVSKAPAASALDRAASIDHADAIVIGTHHTARGMPPRVGHATNRLMRITAYPVIVVPQDHPTALNDGRVVVGVGHGDATRTALRWVAHLARSRPLSIELLHAMGGTPEQHPAQDLLDAVNDELEHADQASWELEQVERFEAVLKAIAGDDVDVAIEAPPGLAASRLIDASEGAAMLVVGRHRSKFDRGHHTARSLRRILTHSRCPVAVIADRPVDDLDLGPDAVRPR